MSIRIGLHAGEAVRDRDDFYGRDVILASRVASLATGEILVSSLVKDLTESSGEFRFDGGRDVELKRLSGKHRVFEVRVGHSMMRRGRTPAFDICRSRVFGS